MRKIVFKGIMFNKMRYRTAFGWLIVIMAILFYGCGIYKGVHGNKHKILSQREVIKEWVKGSENVITSIPGETTFEHPDVIEADNYLPAWISPDFLLVPKDKDIPLKGVRDQLLQYAGGNQPLWLYASPELKEKCYVNSAVSPAFPVSSNGLSLRIEHLQQGWHLKAEDIYLVEDTVVYHYGREELSSVGWRNEECNQFRFDIPANKTGKERFWMVMMYNTDKRADDESNRIYNLLNHRDVTGRHPLQTKLCFIQVTDTVFPERIDSDGNFRYWRHIPYVEKYWE